MKLYQKLLAVLTSIVCLILLICFKTLPSGKLWNEYKVLYVPVETNDLLVKNALNQSEIKDYACLSNQYLPVTLNENSPEVSLFKANYTNPKYSYYTNRNAYFYDKSNTYRLYYIPAADKNKLQKCLNLLSDKNIAAGTDTNSTYPFFLPLIVLCLAVFLCVCSSNRIEFWLTTLQKLRVVIPVPYYNMI